MKDARIAYTEAREALAKGFDPAEVKRSERNAKILQREQEQREPTVSILVQEYLERYAKQKKKTWQEDERILGKDVIPVWGPRKAKDVTRRDVAILLDRIVERGASIQANRTLAVIRRMFNFAVERGVLDLSPVVRIKPPAKENRRDRVLKPTEIKAFWEQLEQTPMSHYVRLALKLLLATGQRNTISQKP